MKLLETLTQACAPSGCEKDVRQLIEKEIAPFVDEIYTDATGNLIARKAGAGKRLMCAAHMDEIGLMVTYIDEKGFLRFSQIGWLPPIYSLNRHVRFTNGTVGIVAYEHEFEDKLKQDKLYIDIGAKSREEAQKLVSVGDCAVMCAPYREQNGRIFTKALDNRAGCFCLIEAAKLCKESQNDVYYVFTAQEEIGLRGAKTAAFSIVPDVAISVDTTSTGDTPEAEKLSTELGKGPAIKVKDNSIITNLAVRNALLDAADGLPYQLEVISDGGTDAGAIHTSRGGVMTGGVSIPTRYLHSIAECVDKCDLEHTITLLARFINTPWQG